jgi:uncharacterized protein YndB with AHSA1/START domain
MKPTKQPTRTAPDEVTLERTIDAPRALVFSAWTDPAHVAKWWGPGGFTSKVIAWDPRPGRPIRIDMIGPNGVVYPMNGNMVEIAPPERFVFSAGALDDAGAAMFDVMTTATFAEQGGKTRITLNARVTRKTPQADQHIKGMKAGWTQSLERLADYVESGPK